MNFSNLMKSKKLTGVLFFLYFIVLSWIILFKMQFDISLLKDMNFRSVNLIPFAGSAIVNGRVEVSEIILNVVAFVPFGIYMSMLGESWGIVKRIIPIFMASLLYEVLQYILAVGVSDITDLLGNTLGGVIGIALFILLSKLLKGKTVQILNFLALLATILSLAFLGILIIVNL